MPKLVVFRKIILLLVLFSSGLFPGCENHPGNREPLYSEDKIRDIDKVITTLYENGQFSGAVLVAVKGKIIYRKAVGYANIEDSVLNTCDTRFRIASFTKPITAMLILQLAEEGTLSLDGKLQDYLPEYKVTGAEKITIHQLLTHTAGITGESRIPNLTDIEKEYYSREKLLECIMAREIIYEPGTGSEYSNFGYGLLGLVIERVTGKPYDTLLFEKICRPSGMISTFSEITGSKYDKQAIGYTYDYFNGFRKASFIDMSFCLGAGQLLSTVDDLYMLDQALYTDKLLAGRSRELFFTIYGWRPVRYPYGKNRKTILSNNLEGSVNGFQSHTQRISRDSILIVALRNVKESVYENQIVIKWPSALASPILSIIYGEEYDMPKKSAAFALFKTLNESGPVEATKIYNEISSRQKDSYYFDDTEFDFFEKELQKSNLEYRANEYLSIRKKP